MCLTCWFDVGSCFSPKEIHVSAGRGQDLMTLGALASRSNRSGTLVCSSLDAEGFVPGFLCVPKP